MNHDFKWLLEIIEKRRNGFVGISVRFILLLISLVYRGVIEFRNWAFNRKWFTSTRVECPVISIGNLTVGGSGKTPIVIWFANLLGGTHATAIISRGYRSVGQNLNDEGLEISNRVDGVLQIQNRDRVAAARQAILQLSQRKSRTPLVILDDGFQHRRLWRDLDVVVVDATQPFGLGHLLPRGLLREPISAVTRADIAILTRSNLVSPDARQTIKNRISQLNPAILWAESRLICSGWQTPDGKQFPLEYLSNKRLLAFCGIGNPSGFWQTLRHENLNVAENVAFSDHHHYCQSDLQQLQEIASQRHCQAAVCTQKDLVKISVSDQAKISIFALKTEIKFVAGEQTLVAAIDSAMKAARKRLPD